MTQSITRSALQNAKTFVISIRAFRRQHGMFPRIISPRSFNEKVLWRILFDRRDLLRTAADKLAARQYALGILDHSVFPKLHFVTQEPEALPFDTLPNRYVVKPTHGSGWVHLVLDNARADRALIIEKCRKWLRRNYFYAGREWAYRDVTPRILVEEFLGDANGTPPLDYKFFVFDGRVRMIQVDGSRFSGHRRLLFDPDWRRLEVLSEHPPIEGDVAPPVHLGAMIAAAEKLGRDVDFMRVDLYDTPNRFVFGEMTMSPSRALDRFTPRSFDYELGAFWTLPRNTRPSTRRARAPT